MTTLELYRKHKKGEIGRDRFLYEVRRDNNLPWITNITSYDDAVKILKNKGIIKEAQFEPQNIPTDPLVDRVNPYALKREVEKLLSKETELTNDSYKEALNKAAKKLTTPEAVKKAMFANAETVEKADAKLQMQPVKKANHLDKNNSMKKVKGQEMPKATAAPTGENKKTKKPKGVEIMKDKGVEGSEKVLREAALTELQSYLKKKLAENITHYEFHEGMEVETAEGLGVIKAIQGGTLEIELKNGKVIDEQMNTVKARMEKKKEDAEMPKQEESIKEYGSDQYEGYIQVSVRDAAEAIEVVRDAYRNDLKSGVIKMSGSDKYYVYDKDVAQALLQDFQADQIEIADENVSTDQMDEARDINDPARIAAYQRTDAFRNRPSDEEVEMAKDRDASILQAIKDLKIEYLQYKLEDEQASSTGGDASSQYYGGILQAIEDKIAELRQLRALNTKQLAQLSDEEFENVLASREEIDAAVSAEPELEELILKKGSGSGPNSDTRIATKPGSISALRGLGYTPISGTEDVK